MFGKVSTIAGNRHQRLRIPGIITACRRERLGKHCSTQYEADLAVNSCSLSKLTILLRTAAGWWCTESMLSLTSNESVEVNQFATASRLPALSKPDQHNQFRTDCISSSASDFWWKNLPFERLSQSRRFIDTLKNRVVTSQGDWLRRESCCTQIIEEPSDTALNECYRL
jgi:hypothetical protein